MRLLRSLLFYALLLWLPLISAAGDLAPTLTHEWVENARLRAAMGVRYLWGGMDATKGLDCSGLVWESAPLELKSPLFLMNLKRSTSMRMERGLDGWTNRAVSIWDVSDADLFFISGHTGLVSLTSKDLYGIIHATKSKGVIEEPMPTWVKTKNPIIKRLIIQHE